MAQDEQPAKHLTIHAHTLNINLSHMVAERSVEEQHLLSVAYKNVADSRRAVRHVINNVEQKEKIKVNEQQADRAKEHGVKLGAEFQKVCDGILALMDENLTHSASAGELEVSYCKMKDIDTEELEDDATKTQDKLTDAVENAEVTEIKRTVFRALTRFRAATIREFEMIAGLETQAIDAYNDAHQYRGEDSLTHDPEIEQVQYIDMTTDVPVVTRDQVLISQTVQKTVEVPRMQYTDRIVGVPFDAECLPFRLHSERSKFPRLCLKTGSRSESLNKLCTLQFLRLSRSSLRFSTNNLWTFQFLRLQRKSLRCSMYSLRTVFNSETWSRLLRPQ